MTAVGSFTYKMSQGEDIWTSLRLAGNTTSVLVTAEVLLHTLRHPPKLGGAIVPFALFVGAYIAAEMEEKGAEPSKPTEITPEQKAHLIECNNALQQNFITMLVEAGEPVKHIEMDGTVHHGYHVIVGLPAPQTFIVSKELRAQIETLKQQNKSWQSYVQETNTTSISRV
jgi:hypothetical protein